MSRRLSPIFVVLLFTFGLTGIGLGLWRVKAAFQKDVNVESRAMAALWDIGQSVQSDIARIVRPAMERTEKLAASSKIIAAMQSQDLTDCTSVCNDAVTGSTEIDAFALFDKSGHILAINNVYADGKLIQPDRIDRILGLQFEQRPIVQSCLSNENDESTLEFQTACDITPALFDSSGLSVAYSVPIFDHTTGKKIGVGSARIRFDRITDLIQNRTIGGKGNSIEFISDSGGYFSEEINSGRVKPAIPPEELGPIVAPIVLGEVDRSIVRHGNTYLNIFRLKDFVTLGGGGIQVMLLADEDWVLGQGRQARLLQAGTWGLIGMLLIFIASLIRGAAIAAANRRDLEMARLEADRANNVKSEFLANMSHEIRTPLTAILGFGDLLYDVDTNPSERLNIVNIIRRNGQHLLALINDILDLSKIEAGRLDIEHIQCNPCQILADVAELFGERAHEKHIEMTVNITNPIPKYIESDPFRLKQAVVNLVGNAIKFTDNGSVIVSLECQRDKQELSFHITDTGPGLTMDQMSLLFQPFTQADVSTTRQFGGTGLGLTISRSLARLLGGDVTVNSERGKGSTFSLTIPTGVLERIEFITSFEKEIIASNPRKHVDIPTKLAGHVLLVEDGPDNQRLISVILRRAGAEVTVMTNGKKGMEEALRARDEGQQYDMILMDMQMPVMDGYTATRLLRENGYTGQIAALTAHAMKDDLQKCLDSGCDHYFSKPVVAPALIRELAARMGKPSNYSYTSMEDARR